MTTQEFRDNFEQKALKYTELIREGIIDSTDGISPTTIYSIGTLAYREKCKYLAQKYDEYIANLDEEK